MFDSFLLMPSTVTMVGARDAMLAADMTRFGGANQAVLWNTFAARGLGETASTTGGNDTDPVAGFSSPFATEGTVAFRPIDEEGEAAVNARLFVGRYEARVTPAADSDPATPLGNSLQMVPGTYELLVQAPGHGTVRTTVTVQAGRTSRLTIELPTNLASGANGATASGDGVNLASLIDDTEASDWASLDSPVAGRQVTVRLDPSKASHQISRVQVSALLRPANANDPGGDTGTQNRFSALRQFQLLACTLGPGVDCTQDSQFRVIYTSPSDAFPAVAPRPVAPVLTLRSFSIPRTRVSFVRLRVLSNQCTGGPAFQGDQDNDPINVTDCDLGSPQGGNVRAAELQVFQ